MPSNGSELPLPLVGEGGVGVPISNEVDVEDLPGLLRNPTSPQGERWHRACEQMPSRSYASRWRPGNICRTSPLTLPNNTETTYNTAATRMIAGPDGMRV